MVLQGGSQNDDLKPFATHLTFINTDYYSQANDSPANLIDGDGRRVHTTSSVKQITKIR